jgi:hypothetical protein
MTESKINPSTVQSLVNDAKSLLRPTATRVRGRVSSLLNDGLHSLGKPRRFPETFADQWRRVLANSGEVLSEMAPAGEPRVLFATVWGAHNALSIIDAVTAMGLRLRGASPTILSCDMQLPACEENPFGNFDPSPGSFGPKLTRRTELDKCRRCSQLLDDGHKLPGLEWASFRDVKIPEDLPRIIRLLEDCPYERFREFKYKDISVGEHAYASVCRVLLRGTLKDDPATRHLFRRYLTAAILTVDLGERLFARVRPQRVVAAHGVYVTQGTLCELAVREGIPIVVFGAPYRKGTVWLCHGDTYHRALVTQPTDRWESLDMTPVRTRIAEEYLESKHVVPRDYNSFHVDSIQDHDTIRREVGFDERPIVSLYTNILWDAQLYYKFNAFPNMLDWVFETIGYFESRKDLQLAIRLHPAEARGAMPTNQPLLPEIVARYPTLPENVKIIAPETKVSSYSLGAMSVAALIYGARIGVELAVLGTPVIVAGETFVRRKGFSYDAESREAFFALLDRVKDLPRNSEVMIARAKKWYYYYFFRLMLSFPFFEVDESMHMSNPRLRLSSLTELEPGRSKVLDLICQGIMDGKTPFEYDEWEGSVG